MTGRVHSFQSLGAVDGPGLRYVIFTQGCPLRCVYCHNPDTWDMSGGEEYSAAQVVKSALRYKPYFGSDGGVTLSGGEALTQPEFAAELFRLLKAEGVHTALDTSGIGDIAKAEAVLEFTDLVICDIKFVDEESYRKNCGGSLNAVLRFLKLCEDKGIPLWVRHVVVPGLTDTKEEVGKIIDLAQQFKNLEKIELLPFRKLCESKYEQLGIEFPLKAVPECGSGVIERLKNLIPERFR